MESEGLRARSNTKPEPFPDLTPPSSPFPPVSPVSPVQPAEPAKLRYGLATEIVRAILLVDVWIVCTITIHISQWIGAPLYYINKDLYYAWMAFTKQQYGIFVVLLTQFFAPTPVIISGDESVQGQLSMTADGRLETKFPDRLVLIANHQLYTDWLYLWWIAYTNRMHGHIFIVLKDVFKYVPLLGPGMMFFGFIFMSRKWATDQARMSHRLRKLKTTHDGPMSGTTRLDPMWFLIYPEGTNLSANTRRKSGIWADKAGLPDMRNEVLPRSTGLHFVLKELDGTVDYVYDITVGYGGIPPGGYGQDIFGLRSTYLAGRPPSSVNFYVRRFKVSEIPIDDTKAFGNWVLKVWREKDDLIDHWKTHGLFPASPSSKDDTKADGWIETEVKLAHWTEIGQIFVMLATTALIAGIGARLWNFVFYESGFVQWAMASIGDAIPTFNG